MAKRQRPKIGLKKETKDAVSKQEALLQKLKAEKSTPAAPPPPPTPVKKKLRFTMDLPVELHQEISARLEESGQTMKGYFLSLAKKDLRS